MNLTISVIAAVLRISWFMPDPGSFYLISTADGYNQRVEMSGHVDVPTHASWGTKKLDPHRIYWLEFVKDTAPHRPILTN